MRTLENTLSLTGKSSHLLSNIWSTTKPSLTRLVVLTAVCGAAVAPGTMTFYEWLGFTFGTWFIVMAANIFNGVLEMDVDVHMTRTRNRPLVTGELSTDSALVAGFVLAVLALVMLAVSAPFISTLLGFLGFFSYVFIYTPLKRVSFHALFVGAIPGAIPPMMGWAAKTGQLDLGAWILFAILFFWQLPHFIAIALNRESEYYKAGFKTLPLEKGHSSAFFQMATYSAILFSVATAPYLLGLAGELFLWIAAPLSILFFSLCVTGFLKSQTLNWGRLIFFGSLVYLPTLLGGWVLDLILSGN
jgi:protoheme IX farnesyltransferase